MYCVTEFYDLKHFGTKITVFSTQKKIEKMGFFLVFSPEFYNLRFSATKMAILSI